MILVSHSSYLHGNDTVECSEAHVDTNMQYVTRSHVSACSISITCIHHIDIMSCMHRKRHRPDVERLCETQCGRERTMRSATSVRLKRTGVARHYD